ncbi:MAG: ABC transporter ATP-binding protein [Clostridia bacterium]|nr:ABC transporter ATP-binding protein [Clostridia bacterium]
MADFERLTKSSNLERAPVFSTLGRIVRSVGNRPVLALIALTTIVEYGLVIVSARATGRLIDAVVSGIGGPASPALTALAAAAGAVAAAEVAKALVILVKDAACGQYLEPALAVMKHRTVEALGAARIRWLDRQHSGDLSARINSDLSTLSSALRPVMIFGVCEVITLLVLVVYLLIENFRLSLVMLCVVPVLLGIQWICARPIQRHARAAQKSVGDIGRAAGDAFTAFETVKSFRLENRMAARMDDAQGRHVEAVRRYTRIEAAMQPLSLLTHALPFFVLLVAGGSMVVQERLTFGGLAAFVLLAGDALPKFGALTQTISGLRHMAASGSRIMELWDAPRERTGGECLMPEGMRRLMPAGMRQPMPSDMGGGVPSDSGNPVLRFDRVGFAYDPAAPVLSDLSFTLHAGETVALAGESGCGKSTVLRLASAMIPADTGIVEMFGRPEPSWDLTALRTHMAYATQEPFLLDASILDNVRCSLPADPDGSDAGDGGRAKTTRILSDIGLGAFVDDLPRGLDTPVGELGSHLSGGQRQRIALARALYRGAPLLLLDEAASALDGPSEAALLRLLSRLPERPAILTVAHRLSSIRHADRILMMQNGRIVEQGTHDELMAAGGAYASLVALQAQEGES